MKLIKPSFEIIEPTGYTIDDIYKSIELAGKVSHKSEHTIKEGSAKEFVDRMIRLGHGATLEFGTVYLKVPKDGLLRNFIDGTPSHFNYGWCSINPIMDKDNNIYITTNYRHIIEHKLEDHLKYLCEPTEHHEKRICVKFICDRAIANEFVRHRKFSFLQESTRYCRYSADKFNGELTFIKPCWTNIPEGDYGDIFNPKEPDITLAPNEYAFIDILRESEKYYIELANNGWKPEQARAVLPNALKTELYMCGYVEDWINFFKLRDDKQHAHPQAYELAHPLHEEFIKREYI